MNNRPGSGGKPLAQMQPNMSGQQGQQQQQQPQLGPQSLLMQQQQQGPGTPQPLPPPSLPPGGASSFAHQLAAAQGRGGQMTPSSPSVVNSPHAATGGPLGPPPLPPTPSQQPMSSGGMMQQGNISSSTQASPLAPPQQQRSMQPPLQQQQQQQQVQQTLTPTQMCRIGAELVQELVARALELFQLMRTWGSNSEGVLEDRKMKMRDTVRLIETYLLRLRIIYQKCVAEYPAITEDTLETMIPIISTTASNTGQFDSDDEQRMDNGTTTNGAALHAALDENGQCVNPLLAKITDEMREANPRLAHLEAEYTDMLGMNRLRNRQIKEIIDRLRKMVWDINTMLAMRKTSGAGAEVA